MNRLCLLPFLFSLTVSALGAPYDDLIARDQPVGHWSANPTTTEPLLRGGAQLGEGPRPPQFPAFGEGNHAIIFSQPGASLRIPDPGTDSKFDFKKGDTITLEAWVQCDGLTKGQNAYIVGKGRTSRPGMPPHNQNWGLRLREEDGTAHVSFVFRDERDATSKGDEFWHRWTTSTGFLTGASWHHVAISYTFGQPESIRGYIDGTSDEGAWDMGGATELGPWVDNDEVWIGTAQGGSAGSSLRGGLDEVAVYRTALKLEAIRERSSGATPKPIVNVAPAIKIEDLPKGLVRVEVFEHAVTETDKSVTPSTDNDADKAKPSIGADASWGNVPATKTDSWEQPAFGLFDIISKYSPAGVRRDRSIPFLLRLSAAITLPPGEHRLLIRTIRGGRLFIDQAAVAVSAFAPKPVGPTVASDAEPVADQLALQLVKEMTVLPPGHSEAMGQFTGDGKPHVFTFELFVGGKALRPEIGQPFVAISTGNAPFRLLTPTTDVIDVTDDGWKHYAHEQKAQIAQLASEHRVSAEETAYWKTRHDLARTEVTKMPAITIPELRSPNSELRSPVDRFIGARLEKAGIEAAALVDDSAFLRRATLDTIGLIPTPAELTAFLADTSKNKRARAVDRLLADPRWADQWVPYWQDVLAENPAILKATLNNTGPFRFFLYDALHDNWAMDRFVTALVAMEGSGRGGGTAGFGLASQNDLPMANKAQILSSAFLGMEMKCARCHDSPNNPFNQEDLFAISAMLQRAPVKVPASSLTQGLNPNSHVVVSLKPGQNVNAHWPFSNLKSDPLPGVLRTAEDSREHLSAILTDPRNERFPQVVANRLWKRLFGFGLVDPVDDWEDLRPSHPELLAWLGRELTTHDYDLKHVARLIMNSDAYQRVVTDAASHAAKADARLFQAQARRRLTAEQLVDSLFQVAGKDFDCEELSFDLDGRRPYKDFLNLGAPQRAWQFVGLSNERDRPSLGKPSAQPFTDVLTNFGWRDSRAEPKTLRDEAPNVIQPALLANGILGERITRLSDDSAFTAMSLRDQTLDDLITQLYQRVLTRAPSAKERAAFTAALTPGYADRLLAVPSGIMAKKARITKFAMWSNHLNAESTPVVYERERVVRAGDPPTPRLATAWRERMEDAVWALMLTPEYTYVP